VCSPSERVFGVADLMTREELIPRHRFRVASHSKTFTAAGVLKLHEAGSLHLDGLVGRYVQVSTRRRLIQRSVNCRTAPVSRGMAWMPRSGSSGAHS
jgi:hypothetical protein